ncbi:hypothetical protein PUR42_12750 [Ralstonia solanacearum]|nr:hypothetical protein [Ralstonia solanacearum]MDD7808591.1 hypothetical protein [Ralstonia solanacearum]
MILETGLRIQVLQLRVEAALNVAVMHRILADLVCGAAQLRSRVESPLARRTPGAGFRKRGQLGRPGPRQGATVVIGIRLGYRGSRQGGIGAGRRIDLGKRHPYTHVIFG